MPAGLLLALGSALERVLLCSNWSTYGDKRRSQGVVMQAENEPPGQTAEERAYYSLSRRVYAALAHVYDAVVFPFRKLRHEVAARVGLKSGARLLDVATGTGQQAFAFATKAHQVVGIDLSEAMLAVARRKNRFSNVSFQQADATALPFDDATFDAVCISFALHEMPRSVRERVVREMARVTRPSGSITVVDYALPRNPVASSITYHLIKLYERDHYASFVKSDVAALLRRADIEPSEPHSALFGAAQIMTGRKRDATATAHPATPEPSP